MKRALVTLATGTHEQLLDIAYPSLEEFADRHGYDILEPELESDRPVSWWKVPALKAVLEAGYDEALWVDADVVIVDPSEDVPVPADKWQALVRHRTGDGDVPNCGVWFVRQPMIRWLDQVWGQVGRIEHGWWEQAALMDVLGFQVDPRPAGLLQSTVLYKQTEWLDNGWNWHMWDTPGPEHVRFAHATMHPDREAVMRAWAADGVVAAPDSPCRHRVPITRCVYCP